MDKGRKTVRRCDVGYFGDNNHTAMNIIKECVGEESLTFQSIHNRSLGVEFFWQSDCTDTDI